MKTLTVLLVLSTFLVSSCPAQLQWTFHPPVHGPDGPSVAYATSGLGAIRIKYVLPAKWAVSGTRFLPPGKIEADAYVDAVPIKEQTPWTPDRAKQLHAMVLSQMVPRRSTDVSVLYEGIMPVQIDGQSSYEICVSYSYYGQKYTEGIVFVEYGKTQLAFHLCSLKVDFENLHPIFIGSLLSVDLF